MLLKNKIAVITGGSRGLGKAIAKRFLEEGATVIITATSGINLCITCEEYAHLGTIEGIQMDVSHYAEIQRTMAAIIEKYGHVDILVNNAGIAAGEKGSWRTLQKLQPGITSTSGAVITDMTEEQFDRVIAINLKGTFACAKAVVAHMIERGYGRIINISSIVSFNGSFGQANYAASKAAVEAMTKTWAKELGRKGITVNAIAPGYTDTEMIAHAAELYNMIRERTPVKRLGTPEDIAGACVYIASDEAAFVNGAVLKVDGGLI